MIGRGTMHRAPTQDGRLRIGKHVIQCGCAVRPLTGADLTSPRIADWTWNSPLKGPMTTLFAHSPDGLRVAYVRAGGGPAVLLLQGGGSNREGVAQFIAAPDEALDTSCLDSLR
jgi:hypothetical protein